MIISTRMDRESGRWYESVDQRHQKLLEDLGIFEQNVGNAFGEVKDHISRLDSIDKDLSNALLKTESNILGVISELQMSTSNNLSISMRTSEKLHLKLEKKINSLFIVSFSFISVCLFLITWKMLH